MSTCSWKIPATLDWLGIVDHSHLGLLSEIVPLLFILLTKEEPKLLSTKKLVVHRNYPKQFDLDPSLLHALSVSCDIESLAGVDRTSGDPPTPISALVDREVLSCLGVAAYNE